MEARKTIKGYAGPYRGKNDYYRDGSYILMLLVNFQAIIIVVLTIGISIYLATRKNSDRFFAETVDGKVMPMISLPSPNPGIRARAEWASMAASDIMTFGFNDMDIRLAQTRKYFTPEGWASFGVAMDKSKLTEDMMKTQQIATAVPSAPAKLKKEGLIKDKPSWEVDVPLLITFRAGSDIRPVLKKVHLVIVTMPTRENPFGWGINQWELN
jgi:hypothetical protein